MIKSVVAPSSQQSKINNPTTNQVRDFMFRHRELRKKMRLSENEAEALVDRFTQLHQYFYANTRSNRSITKRFGREWTSGEVLKTVEILQSSEDLKKRLIDEELIDENDPNSRSYISFLDTDDLTDVLLKDNTDTECIIFILAILYIKFHNRSSARRA